MQGNSPNSDDTRRVDDSAVAEEPLTAELVDSSKPSHLTGGETYNIVSDTVVGANLRVRDNVLQALAIFLFAISGAVIGALVVKEHVPGALVGGFIGLVVGLFGSGIFLMIFRAVRHLRGKHD